MSVFRKNVVASRTTQNVTAAGGAAVPLVLLLVRFLAQQYPELLGGDVEQGALITVLSALATALGGRVAAWFRRRGDHRVRVPRMMLMLLLPALLLAGCITTQRPDGTVERRVDDKAMLYAVELAMAYGPEAYALGLDLYDALIEREVAKDEARVAAAQARIDLLTDLLDALKTARGPDGQNVQTP